MAAAAAVAAETGATLAMLLRRWWMQWLLLQGTELVANEGEGQQAGSNNSVQQLAPFFQDQRS